MYQEIERTTPPSTRHAAPVVADACSELDIDKLMSDYIGEGLNRSPAVNRLDASKPVQLAIDKATPGSVLHAVAEDGVITRDIATALGQFFEIRVESIPAERAQAHFRLARHVLRCRRPCVQRTHALTAGRRADARNASGRHCCRTLPPELTGRLATSGASPGTCRRAGNSPRCTSTISPLKAFAPKVTKRLHRLRIRA
ncbi:hypothetical protein R8871_04041 [Paraburkholderia graminis C4D1M]|jgi:hypothetical protein|uniref:Uncharacterized protein n=1 Tax=Paraburkholderia graminis (strain ATCC 700544 / DSM 17151 / LMG 18924 / NCIMB 13744 / C4D1M) TaxID=396598 RepID=B1G6U1_PARG4|nr:hypothetical protein BgramDRAFT_5087 [Paraburkholderia graminis C4D1M]CAB3709302.1 hypothetical protein R8871_04041 [Paraburkholderia graminis C4D1M]